MRPFEDRLLYAWAQAWVFAAAEFANGIIDVAIWCCLEDRWNFGGTGSPVILSYTISGIVEQVDLEV